MTKHNTRRRKTQINKTKKKKHIQMTSELVDFNSCVKKGYVTNITRLSSEENISKIKNIERERFFDKTGYMSYLKKELVKNNLKKIPHNILPNNDFYTYINHIWLETEKDKLLTDPTYFVEVDDFRMVQDRVYKELMSDVREYINKNKNTEKGRSAGNLLNSLENTSLQSLRTQSKSKYEIIDNYIKNDSMYDLLAHINKNKIVSWASPIVWDILPDEKNVKKYISHLSGPQLGLYDYMLYIDDPDDDNKTKKYKKEVKEKYIKFIKDTFNACDINNNDINPNDIWDVESELLQAMGCEGKLPENPNFYNVVTRKDLKNKYGLDWGMLAEKIGYNPKRIPEKVIVSTTNSLNCVIDLVKLNWNTPKWKTYWIFIYLKQYIRLCNDTRNIYFEFYDKFLKGAVKTFPDDIYPIFGLSFSYNTLLTDLYVDKHRNHLYEEYVRNMGEDLKFIFIKKIERNKWLSPSTKKSALNKLHKLEFVIGKPNKMRDDPIIKYTSNDVFKNFMMINDWKIKKYIELEGHDVIDIPIIDWNAFKLTGTQAYMVNAYYRPTSNSIYVPQAYIQSPFIDLHERGIEYNVAYMGYTLGHELSHSLDDMGSNYDADGNLNNWWTHHDRKIFNEKIKDVVKQYEMFAARDGIKFDAKIGVGEDLADISGLALAEEYLYLFQLLNNDISIIKKVSLELFYIYGAIQSRQTILASALPAQLKMNPHPLEKYRCNCPLSRLQLFRYIYNVQKGDNMWWHNSDTIW